MELFVRMIQFCVYMLERIMRPFIEFICRIEKRKLPAIIGSDMLLNMSATQLARKIRRQEIKSEDLVNAYIKRIKEIDPFVNAVIDDCYEAALMDAKRCDIMCASSTNLNGLREKFPLLGIPFSVKEACGIKGLSQVVGSLYRKEKKMIAEEDCNAVTLLRDSGGIPLLVSANPELCVSWETISLVHGRTNNPYDLRKSSGGSSGGEGALNGAGASVFGLGSDLCGSIRIPAAFNGVFGHKPTGALVPIHGHFPMVYELNFSELLQLGPITRFAEDLRLIMSVLIAKEFYQMMKLSIRLPMDQFKIYYLKDLDSSTKESWTTIPIDDDIKKCMIKAINYFKSVGSRVTAVDIKQFENAPEIVAMSLLEIADPKILENPETKIEANPFMELTRPLFGHPKHSFHGIFFQILKDASGLIPKSRLAEYKVQREELKLKLGRLLGNNGILIYPTFPRPAFPHYTSPMYSIETSFPGIFNMIGFPATHIPMGLNKNGLPIGFQVIAAPYRDKLCFEIAVALEKEFGGWVPPPTC